MSTTSPRPRIKACYSPAYQAETSTASMRKLGPVAEAAVKAGLAELVQPAEMDIIELLKGIHEPEYVDDFNTGKGPGACANGWGWTPQIRNGVMAMNRGQITGATLALEHGIAANVAQGFHHSHPDSGGGYCTFNGLALVAKQFPALNVFVLDCDNHGGDGTADFAGRMSNLFNYSVCGTSFGADEHSRSKVEVFQNVHEDFSDYDLALRRAFSAAKEFKTNLLLYQAGADCHETDPLNSASLTEQQMLERDRMVFAFCKRHGIPCLWVLAGGYQSMDKLVRLHVNTFEAAVWAWSKETR